jgi:hypothetical protein
MASFDSYHLTHFEPWGRSYSYHEWWNKRLRTSKTHWHAERYLAHGDLDYGPTFSQSYLLRSRLAALGLFEICSLALSWRFAGSAVPKAKKCKLNLLVDFFSLQLCNFLSSLEAILMKLLTLFILFFVFQSCASLRINLPSSRFESPESNGESKQVEFGFGVGSTHTVTITPDAASRPPALNQSSIISGTDVTALASIGLSHFLDVQIRTDFGTNELLLKAQLVGDSVLAAVKNNFSVATTLGIEGSSTSAQGNQATLFGPANASWTANAFVFAIDYAVILGYRVNDYILFFGGPFITIYDSTALIHQDAVSNPSSAAADYNLHQKGQNFGGNFDLRLNFSEEKVNSLTIEAQYSSFQWASAANYFDVAVSAFYAVLF